MWRVFAVGSHARHGALPERARGQIGYELDVADRHLVDDGVELVALAYDVPSDDRCLLPAGTVLGR